MGWVIGGRVSKLHLLPTGRLDCPTVVQLILAVEFTTRLADRPGEFASWSFPLYVIFFFFNFYPSSFFCLSPNFEDNES